MGTSTGGLFGQQNQQQGSSLFGSNNPIYNFYYSQIFYFLY